MMYFIQVSLKPIIGVVDASDTPFDPEADNSGEYKMQDILKSNTLTLCS